MTCDSFDARLDALLDGRCTPEEWSEAETHVAACARCRQLFDAMSGRSDDLDARGHEALAAAVVAKTIGQGRGCASARERLCDFVDGALDAFDRELIDGHLSRCGDCSAIADALAEQTQVLATFADLAPRGDLVRGVLAATSRKPHEPGIAEKVSAWLARASQRPRFSVEAAYVMTVLLLVVLGNPVDAFREASVRVQPRVSAVAGAVTRPIGEMRAAGAEKLSRVEQALAPRAVGEAAGTGWKDAVIDGGLRWFQSRIVAPLQSLVAGVGAWAGEVYANLRRAFVTMAAEPGARPAR